MSLRLWNFFFLNSCDFFRRRRCFVDAATNRIFAFVWLVARGSSVDWAAPTDGWIYDCALDLPALQDGQIGQATKALYYIKYVVESGEAAAAPHQQLASC